ncbi:TPA: GNAT family N-acetyltransferase, partial [Legionella anisa]
YLFVSETTRFHIEGLVVDQGYRNQGIGKKLMITVEEFARQFSPCIIDLTSGLRRAKEGSHDFYKSLGYQNEGHMAKLYLRKVL